MNSSSIAYADCFSGISGDMFLAALLHCGFPEEQLQTTIAALALEGCSIDVAPHQSHGISCITVEVNSSADQQLRHLSTIRRILSSSGLPERVKDRSLAVFTELARAEAQVHGMDIEQVHFHEVGAVDTIVDIVGVVAGLDYFGIETVISSPLPSPHGFVDCAHGRLPLPAPAVCELLKGVPCYGVDVNKEMVTPTGAALIKVLAQDFGPQPPMTPTHCGYGGGSHQFADRPNLFRLLIGEPFAAGEQQQVTVVETHVDDWSGEGFPHLCDKLFDAGALDVSLAPILMKKGRPGHRLTVVAPVHLADDMKNIIFTETTTIGIRQRRESRTTLPRKPVEVLTPWGVVTAKRVSTPEGTRIYPEYEECRRVALENKLSLYQVYQAVKDGDSRS